MPTAVWGFNGVVAQDVEAHLAGFNAMLSELEFPNVASVEDIRAITRSPLISSFEKLGMEPSLMPESLKFKLSRLYQGVYLKNKSAYIRTPGVRRTMTWLKQNGWTNIVLSNTRSDILKLQVAQMQVSSYFTEISGQKERLDSESKSDRLGTYLAKIDVRETGIVICDSAEEIEAARQNGFKSIAFTGGWVSWERLKAANPDHVIDRLHEIPQIVSTLNLPTRVPAAKPV